MVVLTGAVRPDQAQTYQPLPVEVPAGTTRVVRQQVFTGRGRRLAS